MDKFGGIMEKFGGIMDKFGGKSEKNSSSAELVELTFCNSGTAPAAPGLSIKGAIYLSCIICLEIRAT